ARFDAIPNRLAYLAATARPLAIHGSGEQVRAIVHIRDASSAVRFCLCNEARTRGELLNVGTWNATINELVTEVLAVAPATEVRYTDQHALAHFSLAIDSERLRSLGWHPQVAFTEGISEVLNSFGPFCSYRGRSGSQDDITLPI